ncbi:MAG: stage II sporulation protein P [Oscillospiraceae bacterium]
MKKAIVSCLLVFLAVRLALFAGAGDALAAWVREVGAEGSRLTQALGLEPESRTPEAEEDGETPAGEPELLLVAVTPVPTAEEGVNLGEQVPPEVRSTTISAEVSIRNDTSFAIDLEELAAEGLSLRLASDTPQILIIHTHGSEAYTRDSTDNYEESDPYRTEDCRYNVIRLGDRLTELFESYGLQVIHDREIYDYPSYTGSYNRSGAAVEEYLAQYPSIQIVIDLHRDALGSGDVVYKTQAEVDGRNAAQVMLLVGTGENGLYHPCWKENLKLALYMQSAMDSCYPTLARPIALKQERYNQHLTQGSLILEVGSTGNTLQEALNAVELFASAVGPALAELVE